MNKNKYWLKIVLSILLLFGVFGTVFYRHYVNVFHMPDDAKVNTGGYLHFSVDDSNSIFSDLTKNADTYKSIFDNSLLGFVKKLHDEYGAVFSFYVFYSWDCESDKFKLSDTTDKFKYEFKENADWLRFGFHAKDADAYETIQTEEVAEYYNKTIDELLRITGSEDCIDNYVRLDRFTADSETVKALSSLNHGIVGLLAADDMERQSYSLSKEDTLALYTDDQFFDGQIYYTPTDIRLENIKNNQDFYKRLSAVSNQPILEVFTHEWLLSDKKVQKYMSYFAEYAVNAGVEFAFTEDRIKG